MALSWLHPLRGPKQVKISGTCMQKAHVAPRPSCLHADGFTAACLEPQPGTAALCSFCRQRSLYRNQVPSADSSLPVDYMLYFLCIIPTHQGAAAYPWVMVMLFERPKAENLLLEEQRVYRGVPICGVCHPGGNGPSTSPPQDKLYSQTCPRWSGDRMSGQL